MLNIPLIDIAMGFSSAIDLVCPQITNHQKRVAYIAYSISTEMKLSGNEIFENRCSNDEFCRTAA